MHTAGTPSRLDPIAITLLVASGFHLLFILGVHFELEPSPADQRQRQILEVIVVRRPKTPVKPPEKPDFLAASAHTGSGTRAIKNRPASSAVALPSPPSLTTPKQQSPPAPTPHPISSRSATAPKTSAAAPRPRVLTTPGPSRHKRRQTPETRRRPAKKHDRPREQPRISAAQILSSRNREISRLTEELVRRSDAYAQRPRRKAISASTAEYKYAAYLEAWRRKVERIGNLNYPDEAKRKKLYGNLILHVAVKTDGSVERIRVLHSSGHKVLDDAAVRIVELAAPFAPFPADIRKETDVLDITRTWQFLSNNQLGWEN